jgi:RNA polymerase sigma-70 factor (ECF subfamily)
MTFALDMRRSAFAASRWNGGHAKGRVSNRRRHISTDWARLVEAVAVQRDRNAFNLLFSHFAPRVKGLMMRNGASAELAEEIAQETLLQVWRKASQFDPSTTGVAAWIFTIARNLRIDAIRKPGSSVPLDQPEYLSQEDQAPTPDALLQAQQDHVRVQRALATLSGDQARAIRDAYYEEKSHGEIAAETDLPLGTVKSRLRLAIRHLRAILDNDT